MKKHYYTVATYNDHSCMYIHLLKLSREHFVAMETVLKQWIFVLNQFLAFSYLVSGISSNHIKLHITC